MKKELWKDIPGYEEIYQASNFGRIRSKPGKTTYTKKHGFRHWQTRILKGRGNNKTTGARVALFKNGKPKDWLVARLVAMTFLGIPKEKLTVNHKNGDRLDNRVENIEWLTLKENIQHGFRTGLYPTHKITLIKEDDNSKHSFQYYAECSRFLNRSQSYISQCLKENRDIKDKNGNKYYIKEAL